MSVVLCAKIWQLSLDPSEKLVLLALGDYANDEGKDVYPGYNTLAQKTGLSERTIIAKIQQLETDGLVKRITTTTGRGNRLEFQIILNLKKGEILAEKGENDDIKDEIASPFENQKGENSARKGEILAEKGENYSNPPIPPYNENHADEPPIEPPEETHAGKLKGISEQAKEVFKFWQVELNHPNTKYTDDKAGKIKARLREGYKVEELKQAVLGCKVSPFHQGQNPEGKIHDSVELIFRNGSKVDMFMGYADKTPALARAAPNGTPQFTTRNTAHNRAAIEEAKRQMRELAERTTNDTDRL